MSSHHVSASDEKLESDQVIDLSTLKSLFANHLRTPDRLKRPEGLATGFLPLDQFLFWGGIPKGALTYIGGHLGTGATSLWLDTAASVVRAGKWVAWINRDVTLCPLSLHHKNMNLGRFVSIEIPSEKTSHHSDASAGDNFKAANEQLFWLLQELMSSSLFELIGCDLGNQQLKEHQLRKLRAQARATQVALVFLSQDVPSRTQARMQVLPRTPRGSMASVFSLIISFKKECFVIERALHRPTPHIFPRSVSYARFTIHTGDRIGIGSQYSTPQRTSNHESHSLHEASEPALNRSRNKI